MAASATVRGDLIVSLEPDGRRDKFDYVLVETTGLAVGPVAQTFFWTTVERIPAGWHCHARGRSVGSIGSKR